LKDRRDQIHERCKVVIQGTAADAGFFGEIPAMEG
jgi:hypothetical protein